MKKSLYLNPKIKILILGVIGDIFPPYPTPKPKPIPALVKILGFFKILFVNFFVNAFVLSVGYFILNQKRLIKSWKFLKYIVLVTIGGALIDLVYVSGGYLSRIIFNLKLADFIFGASIFLTFLGLVFYNYWLSRKFFNLSKKQAIFIGAITGIFTHPLISSLF